nr:Glycosyl transferase, family 2 [uncultured bacterium]
MRLLVFIVAYHAESTIQKVLKRIPAELAGPDTEVLVIDDASRDWTFERSEELKGPEFLFKLTVLHNPINQGYGGNQKIGYHYAIQNGFDVVALIHGDGQYAPEVLPDLLKPIQAGEADVVFGSRMMESGGALQGGMPLYKFAGNKILTRFQNAILKTHLTEFHSGYRLYTTRALQAVPFHLNTPDFHFDTEIIIQMVLAGQRIVELPIPTYYGDEVCYVNGLKYAKDVAWTMLLARFNRLGLFYQARFDIVPPGEDLRLYESKVGFDSSQREAVDAVPPGSRVLDLGCGMGQVAMALQRKSCRVVGVDQYPPPGEAAIERFIPMDLDSHVFPEPLEGFDHILLLDVVEHLKNPEGFVTALREAAGGNPDIRILVTTGNIGFFPLRIMLLLGFFNYGKRGILDLTHKRLFTFSSLKSLLEQNGYRILETRGIPAPFPLALGDGALSRLLLRINRWLIRLSPGLFAFQIFMIAKPQPTLQYLLHSAAIASQARRQERAKTDV